jgi:hypothetical protein
MSKHEHEMPLRGHQTKDIPLPPEPQEPPKDKPRPIKPAVLVTTEGPHIPNGDSPTEP